MSWNYRVVKKRHGPDETDVGYAIHEVYYDSDGNPTSCTVREMEPWGETLEELESDMKMFTVALQKPVLIFEEIGAKFNEDLIG